MPDDVEVLMHEIAAGFKQSLPGAGLTLGLLALFIFLLLYVQSRHDRSMARERATLYASRFEELMRSLDLPTGSAALIERMAHYLRDPSKRYLLLTHEATFNSCLRKMRADGTLSPALVASLRLRLGYRAVNPEKTPLSSGDITEETPMLLVRASDKKESRKREHGIVASVKPDYLELQLEEPAAFRSGERLTLYFCNFAGLYSWTTKVMRSEGSLLRVAHSGMVQGVQRRSYYRRKITLPVYIRRIGDDHGYIKSLLQDLGGGGARMVNPRGIFERGDLLELAFNPSDRRWLKVPAEVVRLGRDGSLSVRFGRLRESTRDAILRGLFRSYISMSTEKNARPAEEQQAAPPPESATRGDE